MEEERGEERGVGVGRKRGRAKEGVRERASERGRVGLLGLKRARGCAVKERESHDASGPPLYQLSIDSSCMWAPLHNVTFGAVAMLINPQPCSHHATFLLVPSPPRDSLVLSIQGCTCCSVTDRQAQGRTTPRTQTRACCRMALSLSHPLLTRPRTTLYSRPGLVSNIMLRAGGNRGLKQRSARVRVTQSGIMLPESLCLPS